MTERVTDEQLVELAAEVSEVYDDPRSLARFVSIKTKAGAVVDFAPERWHEEQALFVDQASGWDLVLKARQIGFSTIGLLLDLRFALTHPGSQTLIVVHDRKLGEGLFANLREMHDSLEAWGLAPTPQLDNLREIVYADLRSSVRVVEAGATERSAKNKGRSGTIHRLHATEVAFWGAAQATMVALLSAVPEDGQVLIESTPNGAAGVFYALCSEALAGRGRYRFHFFPWFQHTAYRARRLPPAFDPAPRDRWERRLRAAGVDDHQIAWWRERCDNPAIGLNLTLQEFPVDPVSAFRAAGGQWFSPDTIDELTDHVRPPVVTLPMRGAQLRVYRQRLPMQLGGGWGPLDAIIGADVAEGVGGDRSAATVLDRRSGEVLAAWHSDAIDPGDFGLLLSELGHLFTGSDGRPAYLVPERNNNGHATIRALTREASYPEDRIYRHDDGRLGWPTDPKTRPVLWEDARMAAASGALHTPDADTVSECKTIVRDVDGKPRAAGKGLAGGAHDDLFVSWALAIQGRTRPPYSPTGFRLPGL